jgi:hypothetical protein
MGRVRWSRFLLMLVTVAALGLTLAGCGGGGGGGDDSSSSTRITGVVIDQQSSEPVPGATVKVGSRSATTNASGSFGLSVPAGPITVTITAPGYQTGTYSAVADEGLQTNIGVLTLLNADNNPPPPPV